MIDNYCLGSSHLKSCFEPPTFLGEVLLRLVGLGPLLFGEGCCLTGLAGLLAAGGGDGAKCFFLGGLLLLPENSCFGCGGGPSTRPCPPALLSM